MEKQEKMYELAVLLLPTISETDAEKEISSIKAILEGASTEVASEGNLTEIDLAYDMVKKINSKNERFDSAYFTWIKFKGESASIASINEELDVVENVLRYMVVKTEDDDELTNVFSGLSKDGSAAEDASEEIMEEEVTEEDEEAADEASENSNEDESTEENEEKKED